MTPSKRLGEQAPAGGEILVFHHPGGNKNKTAHLRALFLTPSKRLGGQAPGGGGGGGGEILVFHHPGVPVKTRQPTFRPLFNPFEAAPWGTGPRRRRRGACLSSPWGMIKNKKTYKFLPLGFFGRGFGDRPPRRRRGSCLSSPWGMIKNKKTYKSLSLTSGRGFGKRAFKAWS